MQTSNLCDKEKIEKAYNEEVCILCASKERAKEIKTKAELNNFIIEAISIRSLVYNHEEYAEYRNSRFIIDDIEGILAALGIYGVE